MSDTNKTAERLITDFINAKRRRERAQSELTDATMHLNAMTEELGRFMTPGDAKIGETFNIWTSGVPFGYEGDVLLVVKVDEQGYDITTRKRQGNK